MQVMDQVADLNSYADYCFPVQMSLAFHQVIESISLKILFNEIAVSAILFQIVHRRDARMAEGSQKKGFLFKLLITG